MTLGIGLLVAGILVAIGDLTLGGAALAVTGALVLAGK